MLREIFERLRRQEKKYPEKCPFCRQRKGLGKGWARFPNRVLERGKRRVRFPEGLYLVDLTTEAEQEWYDFIVCFHCFRIIWFQLDSHGSFEKEIDLPSVKELTGWKDLPVSPVVLYDEQGNPVYGTKKSQKRYQK